MPRHVRNNQTDNRTARLKLQVKAEPYWAKLQRGGNGQTGLALGYRRGPGTWIARKYAPSESRPMTYEALGAADDHQEADGRSVLTFDQAADKAREWLGTGAPSRGAGKALTVKEAFGQYVAYLRRHKSPSAAYGADGFLLGTAGKRGKPRKCALLYLHDVTLAELTTDDLERWQDAQITAKDQEGQRRQKDTCDRQLNDIKAALTRAADDKANKYPAIAPRQWERAQAFKEVGRSRKLFLDKTQTRRLLNTIGPGALQDLANAAFLTGLRPGREMRLLTVGAYKPDEGAISLEASKTGERKIFLNDDAVQLFDRLTAGRKADAPMFLKDDGTPWSDANEWGRPLKEAAERIGLPTGGREGFSLYSARHTHISAALVAKARMPISVLAENCGTSQKMIEDHYGKVSDKDRRRFVEAGTLKTGISKAKGTAEVTRLRGRR